MSIQDFQNGFALGVASNGVQEKVVEVEVIKEVEKIVEVEVPSNDYINAQVNVPFYSNTTSTYEIYDLGYADELLTISRSAGGTLKCNLNLKGTKPAEGATVNVYLAQFNSYFLPGTNITLFSVSDVNGTNFTTDGTIELSYDLSKLSSSTRSGCVFVEIKGGGTTGGTGSCFASIKISNLRIEK